MHFDVKGCSPKIVIDIYEEPENQRVFLDYKVRKKMFFYPKSSLHGHAGVHFDVKGCSPKIDKDIFEEPENQRVFVDFKFFKKIFFIQSRLYVAI